MSLSSATPSSGRPKTFKGTHCALINQLATPGLGSLLARRYWTGSGQLLLAVVGFVLIIGWMTQKFIAMFRQVQGLSVTPMSNAWGKWGVIIFVISWFWSLITSIQLLREEKARADSALKNIPPRY